MNAIKHLHKKYLKWAAKIYALECRFQELNQPQGDRRKTVIIGELEVGEAE